MGRLGQDVELRYTPTGKAVATFSLATNRRVKRGEEWGDETTWHNIVVWDKDAEFVNEHLQKGSRCYVAGRIDNRSWEDGEGQRRYKSEVVASEVIPLDARKADASKPDASDGGDLFDGQPQDRGERKPGKYAEHVPQRGSAPAVDDSDIPFAPGV